jgi:hypothetical protein
MLIPTTALPKQASCDGIEKFVTVSALQAGGWGIDEQLIFVRPEAAALWSKLETSATALHIEGPPGTGKSTIAWAWACAKAQEQKVLWVHLDRFGVGSVAILGDDMIVSFTTEACNLKVLVRNSLTSIVVVDGVTNEDKDLLGASLSWQDKMAGRRAVVVTSAQLTAPKENYAARDVVKFFMPSWSFEQYDTACMNDSFYGDISARLGDDDTKDERLANKFFFAGASARWMFSFTPQEVRDEVHDQMRKVANMQSLLAGTSGDRARDAVNHLRLMDQKGNIFIVCEYAMRLISEKCEASFITQATHFASKLNNPVFDGWVFELDFMLKLRLADEVQASLTVYCDGGEEEAWAVPKRQVFDTVADINANHLNDNTWFIPERWNQGGYDAVQLLPNKRLRFVQITRARTHDLKLRYFAEFVKQVIKMKQAVEKVEIVFVIPFERVDFKLPSVAQVSGKLQTSLWKYDELRVVKLKRAK